MKNYKISGVELTESFIGKPVVYIPNHARINNIESRELGTIMHWNEYGVMVDYGYNKCRTRFENLILV